MEKEAIENIFNTLEDFMQLLLIYDEILNTGKRKHHESTNFVLLPVVFNIAEDLL